jgi:hypothetical protein
VIVTVPADADPEMSTVNVGAAATLTVNDRWMTAPEESRNVIVAV